MKSIRKCLGKEINSIRLLYVLLFGIVLFWVLRFICYKQDYILSLYSFVYYFVDYSNGFITRGLIGTLFGFLLNDNINFFNNFLKLNDILVIFWFSLLFLLLFLYVKKNKLDNYSNCFYLLFVFTTCTAFLDSYTSLRLELFWCILLIPMLFILQKDFNTINFLIICCFSLFCMIIHQGFIFVFAPLICVILLDKNRKKEFVMYGIFMCAIFLIFSCFCKVDFDYLLEHAYALIEKRGLNEYLSNYKDYIEYALSLEYKLSRTEQMGVLWNEYITKHIPITLGILVLNLINLIITIKVIYNLIENKKNFIIYCIIFLLPFFMLLIFSIDCERWLLLLMQSLHLFVYYKLCNTSTTLKVTYGSLILYIINYLITYISMAVLLSINYI